MRMPFERASRVCGPACVWGGLCWLPPVVFGLAASGGEADSGRTILAILTPAWAAVLWWSHIAPRASDLERILIPLATVVTVWLWAPVGISLAAPAGADASPWVIPWLATRSFPLGIMMSIAHGMSASGSAAGGLLLLTGFLLVLAFSASVEAMRRERAPAVSLEDAGDAPHRSV